MKPPTPQSRKQFGTCLRGLKATALVVLLGIAAVNPGIAADTGGTTTTNLSSAGRRTYPNPAEETTNALESLLAEVKAAPMRVRESLPELKYADGVFGPASRKTTTATNLLSAEGLKFTLQIIFCPASLTPGEHFALVYLRGPTGALVDWKSQWLGTGQGDLKAKVMDVNYDSAPDFCFICQPLRRPEQIISGYCVTNNQFEPVTAETTAEFGIEFQETTLENGLVIQPQRADRAIWQADKLYEVPVWLLNQSTNEIDLRGRLLSLAPGFFGTSYPAAFSSEILHPGGTLDSVIRVRFSTRGPDRKFGFRLEPLPGLR